MGGVSGMQCDGVDHVMVWASWVGAADQRVVGDPWAIVPGPLPGRQKLIRALSVPGYGLG